MAVLAALMGSVLAQSAPPATTPPATTPPAPAATAPAAPATPAPSAPDLAGTWTGSGKLSNDWPNFPCSYTGTANAPVVSLALTREGEALKGTLTLDLPAAAGSKCPPLRKRYVLTSVTASASSAVFHDPAGHDWALALRGDQLEGIVSWKGGTERGEVLAEGFFGPGGTLPLTRLSGEVALTKAGVASAGTKPPAPAAGGATASGAPGTAQAGGGLLSGVAGIIGANVVGVGALALANHLLRDTKTTTGANDNSCSRRSCSGQPVNCDTCVNPTFIAGGPCGNVPGGVGVGGSCSVPESPCQANLSCDNSVCQDASVCQF